MTMKSKTKRQILKEEKLEKEADYLKALKDFKTDFAKTMTITKQWVLDLGQELENAKTINPKHICGRIIDDLENEILQGQTTDYFIWHCLPTKWKLEDRSRVGARTRWENYKGGNVTKKMYALLTDWTRLDYDTLISGTVERAVEDSRDFRTKSLQKMNDVQLRETVTAAAYMAALMQDMAVIGRELVAQRKESGKLWKP